MQRIVSAAFGGLTGSRSWRIAACGSIALSLALGITASIRGGDEPEEKRPCRGAQTQDDAGQKSPDRYPDEICAESLLGIVSGVYWYEGRSTNCIGRRYEAPSDVDVPAEVCMSGSCANTIQTQRDEKGQRTANPPQSRRGKKTDTFFLDSDMNQPVDRVVEVEVVKVKEPTSSKYFTFRLLKLQLKSSHSNRVRRLGVEVEDTTSITAAWAPSATRKQYVHEVRYDGRKYVVTTVDAVNW